MKIKNDMVFVASRGYARVNLWDLPNETTTAVRKKTRSFKSGTDIALMHMRHTVVYMLLLCYYTSMHTVHCQHYAPNNFFWLKIASTICLTRILIPKITEKRFIFISDNFILFRSFSTDLCMSFHPDFLCLYMRCLSTTQRENKA